MTVLDLTRWIVSPRRIRCRIPTSCPRVAQRVARETGGRRQGQGVWLEGTAIRQLVPNQGNPDGTASPYDHLYFALRRWEGTRPGQGHAPDARTEANQIAAACEVVTALVDLEIPVTAPSAL